MNVLEELVELWKRDKEGCGPKLCVQWIKYVKAVDAKLSIMQQPLGFSTSCRHKESVPSDWTVRV